MSADAWLTLAVVVAVLAAMIRDWVPPSAAMFGGLVALLLVGVVGPGEALSGFANPAPLTVAALFVLARAVEKTGALAPVVRIMLGDDERERVSLARMTAPVSGVSAFLSNTPVVAMLLPQVTAWAEARGRSPSRYLMPLSFAAIVGGLITVIGTSTNIVISGQMTAAGMGEMGFFELTWLGLPIAVVAVVVIVAVAPVVVPARRSVMRELREEGRRFVTHMVVTEGGPLDGKTVEQAGLRHLGAGFLATVERGGEPLLAATPESVLHGGDRLRFVGHADQIVELQAIRGLVSEEHDHLADLGSTRSRYFEAVVGPGSPLVGRTPKEIEFRSRYQAVVLAIHRAGHLIEAKLGEVPFRVGDTLVLMSDTGFDARERDRGDFLLVAPMNATPPMAGPRSLIVGLVAVGIVLGASLGAIGILQASLAGAVILVLTGVLTPSEARGAVDLDVVILIASAFGVAAAVESSGLAEVVAGGVVDVFGSLGPRGILFGVVAATVVLTGLVSNSAAALLMFPVAVGAAVANGLEPRGFAIAVAVAASADFLTPIGYQTNTMVYGPGGYRFSDYARLGAPLTVIVMAFTVGLVPVIWPF